MNSHTAPLNDRTLKIAERQLAMLDRLADIAMDVSEAFASSAMASAEAEKRILADEYFMPEVGRARACGAKDSADSFQKASRAMRLTLMLQRATAEWLDDLESGASSTKAGEDTGAPADKTRSFSRLADTSADDRDRDRRESDRETLIEVEHPDVLPRASFRETVELIGADLGAELDWKIWAVKPPRGAKDKDGTPEPGNREELRSATDPPGPADPAPERHSTRTAMIRY